MAARIRPAAARSNRRATSEPSTVTVHVPMKFRRRSGRKVVATRQDTSPAGRGSKGESDEPRSSPRHIGQGILLAKAHRNWRLLIRRGDRCGPRHQRRIRQPRPPACALSAWGRGRTRQGSPRRSGDLARPADEAFRARLDGAADCLSVWLLRYCPMGLLTANKC